MSTLPFSTRSIISTIASELYRKLIIRTADYIATGFFHNSQITEFNHTKKTITFRYSMRVDRGTKVKHHATMATDIYALLKTHVIIKEYFRPLKRPS
jgi:hypothetical protein